MFRPTVRHAALSIVLPMAAVLATASPASANSFAERAAVSCLSSATVSGILTGVLSAPLLHSGAGTAVAVSAIAASAGFGCGIGVAWTTAAAGYSWAWQSFAGSPEPVRSRSWLSPEEPARDLIHAELY